MAVAVAATSAAIVAHDEGVGRVGSRARAGRGASEHRAMVAQSLIHANTIYDSLHRATIWLHYYLTYDVGTIRFLPFCSTSVHPAAKSFPLAVSSSVSPFEMVSSALLPAVYG